jgi:hypothetical protein
MRRREFIALMGASSAWPGRCAGAGSGSGLSTRRIVSESTKQIGQYRAVRCSMSFTDGEGPWLSQLHEVGVGHGVSLLRWRSGGVKHPHDTPPYPFMPSPTFANSSS